MSHLLTTLLLYRCGYVVGRYISLESKIEKTKENYYNVWEQCGIGWYENDPAPFIKYMLGIVLAAYRDFETRISLANEKLPAIEMVRKAVYEKIGKFTKSEIMELIRLVEQILAENRKGGAHFMAERNNSIRQRLLTLKVQEQILQGHDLSGKERFHPETRHMIMLEVQK